jgi:hypothetical protein
MDDRAPDAVAADVQAARRRDRLVGLFIIVVAFFVALAISWWAKIASRPEPIEPPGPPTIEGLHGFPQNVDPIGALPAARKITKRRLLRGIVMESVKSTGAIDVSTGAGRARYSFQSAPGEGPQPPREPGTLARRPYCGKQVVHLRKEGLVADPDIPPYPCPAQPADPLPEPRCSLREIWARALARGAQPERLARIEYYRSRAGPAWRFEIPGSQHHFSLYGDCGRELDASEATGTVP